ncbi:MAG TPA: MFS transporter [Polyangia bacterium]|nr:MFS transporter [Polyangia bacterium]
MSIGRRAHPLLYFILFLPFGAPSGYVSVALGFLAAEHGISVASFGALAAMTVLPQTYKFLWAPLVDVLGTRKRWYVAGNAVSSLTLASLGLVPLAPANLGLLEVLTFTNSVASAFVAMSTEGIMANATGESQRGRAAAWSQAGNLGGVALGGGLGFRLARELPQLWMAPAVMAVALMVCCLALIPLPEPKAAEAGVPARARLKSLFGELWRMLWSRQGAVAVTLCFLPLGACAASNLLSAVAREWHASSNLVELMNGWLSGVIMIAGCLAAGRLSDAMDRKMAYGASSAILALVALGIAFVPQTPTTYSVLCIAYSFASGLCYGTFTGFVLEVIGGGAASTKYNVFASLSNIPIWYMTRVDGWAADRFGALRMLLFDAAAGGVGIALLIAVIAVVRRSLPPASVSPPPAS